MIGSSPFQGCYPFHGHTKRRKLYRMAEAAGGGGVCSGGGGGDVGLLLWRGGCCYCFRCCCRLQSFTYLTNGYRLSIREGDNYFTPREDNAFSTDRSSTDRCGLDHLVPDLSL